MSIYDRLNTSSEEEIQRDREQLIRRINILEAFQDLLDKIPSDSDYLLSGYFMVYSKESEIRLRYDAEDEVESKLIRSELQKIFHTPATRELDGTSTEKVNWVFTKSFTEEGDVLKHDKETNSYEWVKEQVPVQTLKIIVTKGSLAPGCEVITTTRSYQVKEIVCPEGTNEVVDQEYMGASS